MTETPLVGNTFFGLDTSQLGSQLTSFRRRLSKRLLLVEFSASGLRYAEASPSLDGIRFSHISRVPLPDEALERGVPSDPALMASLIKELCQEKAIPAHRAAVVLSPDVAYQRIVHLPSELTAETARSYLLDSANAAPLPFPLEQTDFDLYPLPREQGSTSQPFLLIAVPQSLIDRVITLLDAAGFELHALELGPFSLLRFLADDLIGLSDFECHLVLELLPDCSQLSVVTSSGPIRFERLSAIRDFPDPDLNDEQRKEALAAGLSAEDVTLKDENYLPISELDLRAILRDVKAVISDLQSQEHSMTVQGVSLSGINSAHPLIKDLFHEALDCPVKLLAPVLMPRVAGFSPDDLLVQASLARLMGLGLGFLPREQLLSCSLPEASPPLASVSLPSLAVDSILDAEDQPIASAMDPLDVEVAPRLPDRPIGDVVDDSLEKKDAETAEKEEVISVEEEVDVEESVLSEGEEEWPSMRLDLEEKEEVMSVEEEEEEEVDVEELVVSEGEEEWPSIKAIPGLQVSVPRSQPERSKSTSQSKPEIVDSSDSSPLGELRFQDE